MWFRIVMALLTIFVFLGLYLAFGESSAPTSRGTGVTQPDAPSFSGIGK